MKKLVIAFFVFTVLLISFKEHKVEIPKDTIRFRIIANSDSLEDQELKKDVLNKIKPNLTNMMYNINNKNELKNNIVKEIPSIDNKLDTLGIEHQINYGLNYFPLKEYKNVIYPEGKYESLVITIGDGIGENWWCILFPPLCLIEADEEEFNNVNYDLYINKIISKF